METQVKYRYADIGHWLARCDHSANVIELNRAEFPKLSPMYRDYVWIHEHVHLLYNKYDESECNRITDEIFLRRASSEKDRQARRLFIQASNGTATEQRRETSPWAVFLVFVISLIVFMTKK